MANDAAEMSLELRIYTCALEFEANIRDFEQLADQSSKAVFRTIWRNGIHRETVAESQALIEKSRLLLYLTRHLLANQGRPRSIVSSGSSGRGVVMNRAILLEHLTLAQEHIEIGSRNIARQEEIIEELEAHGHDTVMARKMLKSFEDAQALSLADRQRIQAELGAEET